MICPFVLGKSFLSSQADMGMSFCEGKKRRKKMELAAITLYKTLVMTMLALLGAFCYKRGIITEEINKNLSDFVLRLLTPVLLFHCFQMEFSQELLQGILVAFVLAGVSFGVIWYYSNVRKNGREVIKKSIFIAYHSFYYSGADLLFCADSCSRGGK